MNPLDQLDTRLAALDRLHHRRHRAQTDGYCRRIARLLDAAIRAFERLDSPAEGRGGPNDDAHHREFRWWASRVASSNDDAAIIRCDPRVEQSLGDPVLMLRAAVRARYQPSPATPSLPD